MITTPIPPREATEAAGDALTAFAAFDSETLSNLRWDVGQRMALGNPLAWYSLRAPEGIRAVDLASEEWWMHVVLRERKPAGTLRVARRSSGHVVDAFSIGSAGRNLVAAWNRAMKWMQENPVATTRRLFGFREYEFGIQALVARDSEDHLFPIEPLPEQFVELVDVSPGSFAAAIRIWGLRLERR